MLRSARSASAIVLTVGRSRDRARRAVEVATRDVRKSERELSLLNETLEKRVDERTAALEKEIFDRTNAEQSLAEHAHELAQSNAELEQFAYVASHDLRAPLRTMAGFVNLLQRDYASLLDERGTTYVEFISDGALRMQTLIDDLLEFSRVRTQTKPFSETSLDGIVARATADLAPLIAETNATITCAALPSVPCDGDQMTRLFENLISNAIKFRSAEPPRIVVEASLDEQECVVSVRDNGIGIDPKFAKRIFLIFQRLHTREEYAGSGIGLAICRQIIECHNGRIWVEPAGGHGSTFKFSLPMVNQLSQREAS